MRVLFAGTPGVRKNVALHRLQTEIKKSFPDQRVFTSFSDQQGHIPLLDRMLYGDYPPKFLEQPQHQQKAKWHDAFTQLSSAFDRAQTEHHFLGLHFVYRYQQIPSSAVHFPDLIDWKPDCIITFIDDAYCARQRIHVRQYPSFTLSELLLWRAEELLLGDILARTTNPDHPAPNYLVAVKHPVTMLARLILSSKDVARVYISYPLTHTRSTPALRKVIDTFRSKISAIQTLVVFDPLTIDELPLTLRLPKNYKPHSYITYHSGKIRDRWPVRNPRACLAADEDLRPNYPIRISCQELLDALHR